MVASRRIVKFVEALWRCIFYSMFCVIGYNALFVPTTVSWILDTNNYFNEWPYHKILDSINFYYQIELG